MRVCWSSSTSIYYNLALEEWCVDGFNRQGPLLLFYVDGPALVVGKNQNPWREAATGWARRSGVSVARRISGGGTVYHDAGNLNFTLIVPRAGYKKGAIFEQSIAALRSLGIQAQLQDGNSLFVGDRKVSGTAFCFRGAAAMHHGTVLVNADLAQLRRSMKPALPEIETRAIASRPASVANITDFAPALTMEQIATAFAKHLAGTTVCDSMERPADPAFTALLKRHSSWEWRFGYTPAFQWKIESATNTLSLKIEKGLVVEAVNEWCRDRVEPDVEVIGCRFDSSELAARVSDGETAAYLQAFDF